MTPRRRQSLAPLLIIVLVPLVLVLGIWLGGHPSSLPGPVRDALVGDKNAQSVEQVLDTIHNDYYRKVNSKTLVDTSLKGAVSSLDDRFSNYFDPKEYRDFQDSTDARFSGVGITVAQDPRGLLITKVFPESPAARAGLRAADVIAAVGATQLRGKPSTLSTGLIKGRPGTTVSLTVLRGKGRRMVRLTRARISFPVVESRLRTVRGVKVADIALSSFTSGVHGEVRQAVDSSLKRGAKGLVLDLRGNGGGLLDEAVLVSSIFVPEGPVVITDGRTRGRRVFNATGDAISGKIPVEVLVDRGTASSAEIVTGALQDRKRATVIGTNTFGKGVFQEIKELPNGGAVELTVGEYFTPSGRNLGGGGVRQGKGIAPNVRAADNPSTPRDEALDVALTRLAAQGR